MLLNSLGRVLVASGLVAVTSFMASTAAFAGTTGTLTLSSTVPSTLTIAVTPQLAATALNLAIGASATDLHVADIVASTNNPLGLKVTATPSGGADGTSGKLVGPGTSSVIYTLKESPTPTGTVTGVLTSGLLSTPLASSIFISYGVVPSSQASGFYQGTILFTAADL